MPRHPDDSDRQRRDDDDSRDEPWQPDEDLAEPETAEAVGHTLEEAISNALEILGAREDEVEIEILQQGHRGFLGMGKSRPFRVRALWREDMDEEVIEEEISEEESSAERLGGTELDEDQEEAELGAEEPEPGPVAARPLPSPAVTSLPRREFTDEAPSRGERRSAREREPAPTHPAPASEAAAPSRARIPDASATTISAVAERARQVAEDILSRMGVPGRVDTRTQEGEVVVQIESDDDALLIGRRGETRAAFQHILQRLVTTREDAGISVLVDVNGYWERRMERLRQEAFELARRVAREGEEVQTEPLSAQERRVIHRALADDPRVTTESLGSGPLKRVAVMPADGE